MSEFFFILYQKERYSHKDDIRDVVTALDLGRKTVAKIKQNRQVREAYPSTYYGWAPCIPDNFLYCNFGIASVIVMLLVTLSIGFVIINILFNSRLTCIINIRDKQKAK